MTTSPTTPPRPTTRALLGTMALVLFMLVYVLAASVLALAILPGGNRIAEFFYYAVAGLAWVPAAGLIVRWMYAPRSPMDTR
ncbi:MAG: DUF2842 domain-containing protein [Hyphomicrobiaceae bacterium]